MAAVQSSATELQRLRVSPPPGAVAAATLPLTFFDVIWLQVPPVQRIFFYHLPVSSHHFQTTHFPALARALSVALHLFFPLAGTLAVDDSGDHVLSYLEGDGVDLTLSESDADFHRLVAHHRKDAAELHPFVPSPPQAAPDGGRTPVLAVQVTVFPGSGVSVGITVNHAAADGSSSVNFLKNWAAIFRSGGGEEAVQNLPIFDRRLVGDLDQLKRDFLEDLKRYTMQEILDTLAIKPGKLDRVVRVTCVLTRSQIDSLRARVAASGRDVGPRPSTFVVATAYLWACIARARGVAEAKTAHFCFAVDCRARLRPPVPEAYFGNCIGAAFAAAPAGELAGEGGVAAAAEAIHRGIRKLGEQGVLADAGNWLARAWELAADRIVSVAGSPRLRVYDTDFGWGPPQKVEIVSIEESGAISLAERREGDGGLEIGLVGPEAEVDRLVIFFDDGLKGI